MFSPSSRVSSLLPFVGRRGKFIPQGSMLVLADIKPDEHDALQRELEQIGIELQSRSDALFHRSTTTHYAAWMILPGASDSHDAGSAPDRLLLETNYDGQFEEHLRDLVAQCGSAIDRVYAHCQNYPAEGSHSPKAVEAFFRARHQDTSKMPTAHYVGLPGRSVPDIRNAIAVYEEAKDFLDRFDHASDVDSIERALVAHFRNSPASAPKRFAITQAGLRHLLVYNLILGFPLMIIYVLLNWAPLCLLARYFEGKEARNDRRHPPWDPTAHAEIYSHLDLAAQNHLCTVATVKPGWFRMLVAKRALALGRILASKFFILGRLDQMNTVHFARWILIGRELLFVGNYDGSWSGYLGDFSDQAWGVNLIWSNTIGFPPTRFLTRGGAQNLDAFETQALTHYAPAPVFYSAYPGYPQANIVRILEFRDALAKKLGI